MPVSPARSAAFDILLRVERESSYASDLLHSRSYERLTSQDHALATELVMGVLRWRSRLDDEIAMASSQPLSRLDLEVLIALRLALYQFRFLDRIPPRAALHESVELVKSARKHSAAPFVNAVLRKLSKSPPLSSGMSSSPQALAATWSHPRWLVERWVNEYGLAATQQICEHNQSPPTTSVRLRTTSAEGELITEGIHLLPGALLSNARRITSGDITKTKALREGDAVIQDEASQLVAALVDRAAPNHAAHILDCCAAPGGKTLAIADENPDAQITAVEIHPHRARLLQKRLPANPHIRVLTADARALPLSIQFDRILADVPCSGTGTLARNPEIKWRLTPRDLTDLHDRQLAILRSALTHLKPAGRLVYSTCSLEKEENEGVVQQVVSDDHSIHLIDCNIELDRLINAGILTWPDPHSLTRGPYLRTIPGVHPCEGFFAAILQNA